MDFATLWQNQLVCVKHSQQCLALNIHQVLPAIITITTPAMNSKNS